MDLLLVNWQDLENPQAGGAEVHLFELFGRLAERGHRVRLVCSGWRGAPRSATVRGIEVERHGDRHTFALRGRGAVRRALAARRPDVLVEDVNKLPLCTAGLADVACCVIVPHLFGTTAFAEVSWPMAAAVVAAERLIPRAYRRAGFHAISESTRDDLVARGVPRDRIRVIHPGVDGDHYHPTDWRRTGDPTFLYVGRLKRYKGVDVALRALASARTRHPGITLDIAGSGDHRPALEALAARLGLGAAVRFHGRVDEAAKRRLLREAWANVFPSPKEGWGITVMEAAACGTPTIASDSPGLRDSVRRDETGLLVPHGDVEAMAEAMVRCATDAGLVRRLGEAARAHAERLTWATAVTATEEHLTELARARASGS